VKQNIFQKWINFSAVAQHESINESMNQLGKWAIASRGRVRVLHFNFFESLSAKKCKFLSGHLLNFLTQYP
jgi:hypothetical protein